MHDPIEIERVKITLSGLRTASCDVYETGFVTSIYKKQLLELKWYIEDLLKDTPMFGDEDKWEAERTLQLLKKKEKQHG